VERRSDALAADAAEAVEVRVRRGVLSEVAVLGGKRMSLYLRVGVSSLGVIGAVLFAVLWGRSYWWSDDLIMPLPGPRSLIIHSLQGTTAWQWGPRPPGQSWAIETISAAIVTEGMDPPFVRNLRAISLIREGVVLPHWVLIAACATCGVAPWMRWRFSVRKLLILITALAVLLAVIIFD
jgi:hypothetical protein